MSGADHGWRTARPHAALRQHVTGYVGYRAAQPPGVHRGLPSGAMTFIVSLTDDIAVLRHGNPQQGPATYGVVLSGLHTTPTLIGRGGVEEGVAIDLTPLGSRALLGRPAADLASWTVEASEVLGRAAVELRERLAAADSWPARFAVGDEVLTRLVASARDPSPAVPAVAEAWRLVAGSGGRMPVGEIASRLGCSRRYLSGRFREEFGVSPKAAARVVRFGAAVAGLRADPSSDLGKIAHRCGYSDQSHMTREFAAMAGCPPSVWLREEFPEVVRSGSEGR